MAPEFRSAPPTRAGIPDPRFFRGAWICLALAVGLGAAWPTQAATAPLAGRLSGLFAGNASSIDNAEPEPMGQLDAELDFTYAHNHQTNYAEFPLSLTYGLLPRWDLSVSAGGVWESYASGDGARPTAYGLGDTLLNSKFKLLDQERFWATQSIELGVKLPTASRTRGLGTGRPNYDLTWMVTRGFTDRLVGDFNLGYTWLGNSLDGPLSDQFHYGIALEYAATRKLSLVGQLFAATPSDEPGRTEAAVNASIGWRLTPRFSAHASVTKGLGKLIGVVGTVGVTWTFGPPSTPPKPGK